MTTPRIDIESSDCDLCGRVGPLKIEEGFGPGDVGVCSGGCNRPRVTPPTPEPTPEGLGPWHWVDSGEPTISGPPKGETSEAFTARIVATIEAQARAYSLRD